MADGLILETTFLIDLERERRRAPGPASQLLRDRSAARLYVTLTTAGEVAGGLTAEGRGAWENLLRRFDILPIDIDVCWAYGQAYRYLRDNGLLIGANDLWIAATAVVHDLPLVTRDERHFSRVPGLRVIGYGGSGERPGPEPG